MSTDACTLLLHSTPGRWAAVMVLGVTLLAGNLSALGEEPLEITSDRSVVSVKRGDQPVLEYQYVGKPKKPYAKEWFSPGGVNVLRDAPLDHLHHHGLMFAVAVDGVDFWSENEKCGQEKHVRLADVNAYSRHGLSWCTFTQHVDWVGPDGETLLMQERRTIDCCRMPAEEATLLIWQSRFEAPPGKPSVTLSGSTYFGLGMRFVQSMDKGGRFQNADAGVGVEGTNDVRSAWCAYSAATNGHQPEVGRSVPDGKPVTVAMFDCPANPRFPATWFTLDSAFAYLSATLNLSKEPLVIESGRPLELRYAASLWDGHVDPERIEKLYRQLGAWFSHADAR